MHFPMRNPATGQYNWSWWPEDLDDGWSHERDRTGFCENCGAVGGEPHYKLRKRTE